MSDPWHVIDTPCFPKRWKVVPRHTYRDDNSFVNFYEEKEDAERIANARNEAHRRCEAAFLASRTGEVSVAPTSRPLENAHG